MAGLRLELLELRLGRDGQVRLLAWAPEFGGQKVGSKRFEIGRVRTGCLVLVETVRYVYTPLQKKVRAHAFPGAENDSAPEFWSPDQDSGGFADLDCVLGSLDTLRHLAQKVCRAEAPAFEHCEALRMRVSLPHEVMLCKRACALKRGRVGRAASRLAADARERSDYLLKRRHDTRWRSHAHTPSETFVRGRSKAVAACWTSSSKDPCFVGSTATLQTQSARARAQHSEPGEGCRRLHSCEVAPQGAPSRSGCRLAGA